MMKPAISTSPDGDMGPVARALLDRAACCVAVVDEDHVPIAFVDRFQLLREGVDPEALPSIREVMNKSVACLPATASISQAAALMAFERRSAIMIVDAHDRLIGQITAIDVMRWLARREGYLVP
jgi:CBS-domain-containing membrane protein